MIEIDLGLPALRPCCATAYDLRVSACFPLLAEVIPPNFVDIIPNFPTKINEKEFFGPQRH